MKQLTHETMPQFMEQLRTLVEGHRFTHRSIRGHTHTGMSLKQLKLEGLPGGLKMLSLDMGGVVQPFTSYFADSSSKPLVNDIQTVESCTSSRLDRLKLISLSSPRTLPGKEPCASRSKTEHSTNHPPPTSN